MRRVPALVEPLAGIKIISISAGGWHSAAVSSFGDVYLWGFNSHGQLGIRLYKDAIADKDPQKNPSVYPIPQLVEVTCSCTKENKSSKECSADSSVEAETEVATTSSDLTKSSDDTSSTSESSDKKDEEETENNNKVQESNNIQEDAEMPLVESTDTENKIEKETPAALESEDKENKAYEEVSELHLESNCNVVKAFCGARHTIIQMECGKFFAVGSNENGQLGLGLENNLCDQFREISAVSNKKVVCGPWSTIFQDIK